MLVMVRRGLARICCVEVIQKEKKMPVKGRYCKFAVGLLLKFNLQEIQVVPWLLKVAQDRWKLLELQAGDVDVQGLILKFMFKFKN